MVVVPAALKMYSMSGQSEGKVESWVRVVVVRAVVFGRFSHTVSSVWRK